MNKRKLLLTSAGLSSETVAQGFESMAEGLKDQPVAIITTAAEGKEENKYSQLAKKQIEDMGFANIDFVDFETEPNKDLSSYGVFYVCGGNTFKLLKFAKEANFKSSIEELFKRNGLYIGVSAGSIIVSPSVQIAGEIEPDDNEVGLDDLTGLNLVNMIILPHYSLEIEEEVVAFEKKYSVAVERLNNSQAVFIKDDKEIVVG